MKGQPVSNLTLYRAGCVGLMILYALWLSTSRVQAKTTLFAESFAGQLGTNWQLIRDYQMLDVQKPCMNRAQPASWIQHLGKLVLEIDGPSCVMDLSPSNVDLRGLSQYTLSFRMQLKDSIYMDRSFVFLWMNANNWYDLKFFGNSVLVEKVVQGTPYQLDNSLKQFPFQPNREYQVSVEVTKDRNISVWIDQQHILDVEDNAPFITSSEKQSFTLRGAVGAVPRSIVLFDDIVLETDQTLPSIINLNVPLWKQSDPAWKELEYDNAHVWSSVPTMNRWGCAVTSMAMILRYYGISELPSGEPLSPQSLNVWLKSQVDGYFQGNVNWLAFSRLTQIMSQKLGTAKLEFSRAEGSFSQILAYATQELNASKPVILGYPGHFFVADGVDKTANTLLTKDPYFNYQRLNQRPTQQEINTIRRFQPSHTDLSYILLNASPGLMISVKTPSGASVPVEPVLDYLSDATGETAETSPLSSQYLIQKPDSGEYIVTVSQPAIGAYTLDSFEYDVKGNVTEEHFQGTVGAAGKELQILFQKEPTLSPTPSPSPFPSVSPTPSPASTPTPKDQHLRRQLRAEIRRLENLLQVLRRYQRFLQKATYQYFFLRLERLKEQTNWPSN